MTSELLRESFGLLMLASMLLLLPTGFPVPFTIMGCAVAFAFFSIGLGLFDAALLAALPLRLVGLMENDLLQAIPLFIYLGVILQRTTLAADLLETMSGFFGSRAGGLGISSIILGALLAPTTGVVGATVLTIGMLALPTMLNAGYDRRLASGIVCCAGTLGTVLPPSIILIMLSAAMRDAQAAAFGRITRFTVNHQNIYLGVLIPVGLLLCGYLAYVALVAMTAPQACPPQALAQRQRPAFKRLLVVLIAPLLLIVLMLASIVTGYIYTVEAAAIGAIAITILAMLRGELTMPRLAETVRQVTQLTAMVFTLLIGATTFTLVFRGFGGDAAVTKLLGMVPGGLRGAVLVVLMASFVFCLFLDALEILVLVIPITMPPLLVLGGDPVWLAVLFAITIQTGFLIPPSGFAICFLRSVAPPELRTADIYSGAVPIIGIQALVLTLLWMFPWIATSLPSQIYGSLGR